MRNQAKPTPGTTDRQRWLRAFGEYLRHDDETTTRSALKHARDAGCTQVNLAGFLYAYVASQKLIFGPRAAQRDAVADGLKGVAARLIRTASATEKVLSTPWWKGQSVADLLQSPTLTLSVFGATSEEPRRVRQVVGQGRFTPTFILELPVLLRTHATWVRWLDRELRRELTIRKVGRTLYLAQLVVYWKELSGNPPEWRDVAALVEAARIAAGSEDRTTDGNTLSKNFASFRRRCPLLYQEICSDLRDYISSVHRQMSYFSWQRRRKESQKNRPASKESNPL
jgi:hypothetical protein